MHTPQKKRDRQWQNNALIGVFLAIASTSPAISAEEIDPMKLIKEMSAQISALDAFVVTGDAYADARLAEGQIIEHTSNVTLRVVRPDAMRMTNISADGSKEIYLNDGVFSVSTLPQNFYAQTEIPRGIEEGVEFAMDELEIDAPLLDLLMKDVAANLTEDASNVRYLGESLVRGKVYHHIGLRAPEIDLQIWISADGPPLPGKVVLTSKWEGGSPRFVSFLSWDTNPDIPSGALEFSPADDAVRIEFIR